MKKLLNIVLLIALITVWGCNGSDNESMAQNKTDKIKKNETATKKEVVWMNFDDGMEKGAKEKKNILIDFYTDWCHWCKVMDEKTFSDPKVAKKLKERFVTIRINAESNTEKAHFQGNEFTNVQLTQAFRVTGFPSLGFVSPEKEVVTVIPGYIPADQFYNILDYIDKECYKKQMSFDDFMKRKGECDSTNTDNL